MKCVEVRSVLQIYLDNELDAVETSSVERHLRGCEACGAEAEAVHALDRLLREAVSRDVGNTSALRERIRADIAAAPNGITSQRRRATLFVALAAAAVVALAAGVAVFRVATNTPRQPSPFYANAVTEHMRAESSGAGPVSPGPELTALVSRFTAGRPAVVEVAGMRLVGGHPCHIGEEKYAHIVYMTPDGHTISVYLCAGEGELPEGSESITKPGGPVEIATLEDELVAVADRGGVRRVVVGDASEREAVMRALEAVE